MKMRSWNYITFDQLSEKVTSTGGKRVAGLRRVSRKRLSTLGGALVVSAALLANTKVSTKVQPITGTNHIASIRVEYPESTSKTEPPFLEHFSGLLNKDFLSKYSATLQKIATVGSSLDTAADGERVALALRGSEFASRWKEMA